MAHASAEPKPRRGITLTQQIFIGLALGIIAGWIVSEYNPAASVHFRPFSQLFLRMIKMVIAPLIFATLVAGIAVPARILIARDCGPLGNGLQGWGRNLQGMRRVSLADQDFEARFEVYADRPDIALAPANHSIDTVLTS